MKTSTLFPFIVASLSALHSTFATESCSLVQEIVNNAIADNIDLSAFDTGPAFNEISGLSDQIAKSTSISPSSSTSLSPGIAARPSLADFLAGGKRIDVHTHIVPGWYRSLVPVTGGNPTPTWNLSSYISFMDSEGIDRAVVAFSAPAANVFQGNKAATVALARVMNEQAAAYCAAYPSRFKFYAVVPLPYVQEAITEATYALTKLGAAGIFLTSNFEGTYLGNTELQPFFEAIDKMNGKKIFFIHPGTPYLKSKDGLIEANPTPYPTGNIEFYFETTRTLMDLTLTGTLQQFQSINYIIPHAGGSFPSGIDRILKAVPSLYDSSLAIYRTRFWWDSAGPTYYHQISGLLGYQIPKSQLLFGTDYPYAPGFTQTGSLGAILSSPLLTAAERTAFFTTNARNVFSGVNV